MADARLPEIYRGPQARAAALLSLDPSVHPDPLRPARFYRVLFWLVRLVVRLFFRLRVEGLESLPAPPFLIAANHQAWYDSAFIIASLRPVPMVYTMARRDTVFNRGWKRWLVTRIGVFPIQPQNGELDQRGLETVYQILDRRGAVLMFPEGGYSRGSNLRPLKAGVAHFSLQAGVPICPVAVSGLESLRPFRRVTVSIGPPIWPDPPRWWSLNRRVSDVLDRVRGGILGRFGRGRDRQPRRPWWRRLGRRGRTPPAGE